MPRKDGNGEAIEVKSHGKAQKQSEAYARQVGLDIKTHSLGEGYQISVLIFA